MYSKKVFDIHNDIDKITETYEVIKRAVDFDPIKSSNIDAVLKPNKRKVHNLLTEEEQKLVRSVVFDVTHWEDSLEDQDDETSELNLWKIALKAQEEIDADGAVSEQSRDALAQIKASRKKVSNPRLYADVALIAMFADFFEEYNEFSYVASMSDNPSQPTKKSHKKADAEVEPELRTKWKAEYNSPFHRFLEELFEVENIKPIGSAYI